MGAKEIIKAASDLGIYLYVDADKLKYKAKPGALTTALSILIKQSKQDIIDALLQGGADISTYTQAETIPRLNLTKAPLSFSQRRIWLVDRMRGGSPQYNLPLALEIIGKFDIQAAEAAIQSIIDRHEILRTTYADEAEYPVQIVHQDVHFTLAYEDFASQPDLEASTERYAQAFFGYVFNLREESVIRGAFLKTGENKGLLLINTHHIATDGWSIGILVREFATAYHAESNQQSVSLPPLPIQYSDYASWQQNKQNQGRLKQELDYWRTQLDGAPASHGLPVDVPANPDALPIAKTLQSHLPVGLVEQLDAVAKHHQLTWFMLFHAAYSLVVSRFSNENDIVISSSVANRMDRSVESLIGFFLNTLALRVDTQQPSLEAFLKHVREVNVSAQSHQQVPFEQVLEATDMPRNLAFTPLTQIAFAMNTTDVETVPHEDMLDGLEFTPYRDIEPTAKSDLRLRAKVMDTAFSFKWTYDSQRFSAARIQRISDFFTHVLTRIATLPPEFPLHEFTDLPVGEQQRLITLGTGAACSRDNGVRICDLVLHQAERQPDETAIICGSHRVPYQQLAEMMQRLAAYLQEVEIASGARVGLLLPQGSEWVFSALSVLLSGAAYVPLLPNQGEARLKSILATAGIELVLTCESLQPQVLLTGVEVMCVDDALRDENWLSEYQGQPLDNRFDANDLAYVIYTSGSSGTPKGVEISHAGLMDYCQYAKSTYYRKLDGALLATNPVFDISIPSLFVPMISGGSLNLPGEAEPLGYLAAHLQEHQEQRLLLRMTPMHVEGLLDMLPDGASPARHAFVVGGEAFPASLARRLVEAFPDSQVFNHYGPTETVVGCAIFPLSDLQGDLPSPLPIGRAMDNTQLYVLDNQQHLLPFGSPGELYIGGLGVAKGYVNQPELTQARFTQITLPGGRVERVYRSGDQVCWNQAGDLTFLGRLDDQVKIRGFRIEPGEIQAHIKALEGVESSTIHSQYGRDGQPLLVAYVVPAQAEHLENPASFIDNIRTALKQTLPDYMVPGGFMLLESLPLGKNGKLNKRALPEFLPADSSTLQFEAPKSPLEQYLAVVWGAVLKCGKIGRQDNFFDLGGHSLLAIRAINQIQHKFKEVIHLVALFDHPTLAAFSAYLQGQYADSLCRVGLLKASQIDNTKDLSRLDIDDERVRNFHDLVPAIPDLRQTTTKNKRKIVIVLSPPRSGSTLLRVMLAGHPGLFAPPEMELLQFNTLGERKEAYSGCYKFRLEGTLRTIMQAKGVSLEDAQELMAEFEQNNARIQSFYETLQSWVAPAILVDKTPYYSYHPAILEHAETLFDEVHYIHLLRHPCGTISSFEKAQMNQVLHLNEHDYSLRQLGEMVWANSHQNINGFLAKIPEHRQHKIFFEHLLKTPEAECRKLCDFLGIEFSPLMLNPYDSKSDRMTNGTHSDSRMLGDVNFHQHKRIDSHVGEAWKSEVLDDFLSDRVWQMAEQFGYRKSISQFSKLLISPIAKRPGPVQPIPLSSAQQRLWFIDQMIDGNTQYNNLMPLKVEGRFDVDVAEQALLSIVERHEILRTRYIQYDSTPMQVVSDKVSFRIQRVDYCGLFEAEEQDRLQTLIKEEDSLAFDLTQDLMLRARYAKVSEDKGYLLFNIHHIASDGWSMSILIKEFVGLYQAILDNQADPLPVLPIQYGDYAYWQKQCLDKNSLGNQLSYWEKQLSDAPAVHGFPLDHPRPEVKAHQGDWITSALSPELSQRLRDMANEQDITLFMLLHAALSVVIAKHSYRTDIVIGTPNANRRHQDLESLIGFFINTLVLRTRTDFDYFVDLLRHVREVNIDAQANQDVPFDYLVERLNVPRSTAHSPVFQIIFNMGYNEIAPLNIPGVEFSLVSGAESFIKFDLHIIVQDHDDHLNLNWGFDTSLFNKETVERLKDHMLRLLNEIVARPNAKISELNILSQGEKRRLQDWREQACHNVVQVKPIIELFEQQAAQHPHDKALACQKATLTYQALDTEVSRLSHYFHASLEKANGILARANGADNDCDNSQHMPKVAFLLERSTDCMIAILAALKSHITYVPIDPANPQQRIDFILDDAQVDFIVAHQKFGNRLTTRDEMQVYLDSQNTRSEIAQLAEQFAMLPHQPEHTAYIIYTSGSTGRPKGVEVTHANLSNFYYVFQQQMSMLECSASSPWVWNASYAFDASLKGVAGICSGRPVVVPTDDQVKDLSAMIGLIREHQAEVFNALPQVMAYMVRELDRLGLDCHLMVSGDVVRESLWGNLAAYAEKYNKTVLNVYGPTEATVNAAFAVVQGEAPHIGLPVYCSQLTVLDPYLQPAPEGVMGEIAIGGYGVAKGYWRNPQLTATKFIQMADHTQRWYRSGDLGKLSQAGRLEFLGRIDHQVKVRGYRIELGEVEKAISNLDEVAQAYVSCRELGGEPTALIAYIVSHVPTETGRLLAKLGRVLPEYMVPSHLIVLSEFPRTSSGKIDVSALSNTSSRQDESVASEEADGVMSQLCAIWCDILCKDNIDPEDNFFRLGGHSLLAMKLLFDIEQAFGAQINIRDLFTHLTLQSQAELIETRRCENETSDEAQARIQVVPDSHSGYPLSYAQQRLWFIDQLQGGSAEYNMFNAFILVGDFDVAITEEALRQIIMRHEALRTRFVERDGRARQYIESQPEFKIKSADLTSFPAEERDGHLHTLMCQESQHVFRLDSELPLRVMHVALETGNKRSALLINLHHICSDGWSMGILTREFVACYQALVRGNAPSLPALTIQYRDYAHWQMAQLSSDSHRNLLGYWQAQLADAPVAHSLPFDFVRPENKQYRAEQVKKQTARHTLDALNQLASQADVSLFMLLHAALSVLLTRHSNCNDIVIGTPVANRLRPEVEPLIGFFLNMLALRTQVTAQSFNAYLQSVKQINLDAQSHQDLPFEMLVEELNVPRTSAHAPLFQIMFNMNAIGDRQLSLPDVDIMPISFTKSLVAKYDLNISAQEADDGLHISWVYDAALFDAQHIERLADNFICLLGTILSQPTAPVDQLEVMPPSHYQQILALSCGDQVAYPADMAIHHLFEQQVLLTPKVTAIEFASQAVSYTALNRAANQVAHHLIALGVTADTPVGICCQRSIEMVVAIIAVLKSGGAYLPLEPDTPKDRLSFIAEEAGIRLVLCHRATTAVAKLLASTDALFIEGILQQEPSADACDNPTLPTAGRAHNLAYIIYTSGSTGKPKGVMIEHQALVNRIDWMQRMYPLTEKDKVLQKTPYTFDVSVWEFLWPLSQGATLVVAKPEGHKDPAYLSQLIAQSGLTTLHFVPSMLHVYLGHHDAQLAPTVRQIFCSGEALNIADVKACRRSAPHVSLHNLYGPTEAAIDVSFYDCAKASANRSVPIGKPIQNVQLYVLDPQGHLCPTGTVGELFIAGDGLARGYINGRNSLLSASR